VNDFTDSRRQLGQILREEKAPPTLVGNGRQKPFRFRSRAFAYSSRRVVQHEDYTDNKYGHPRLVQQVNHFLQTVKTVPIFAVGNNDYGFPIILRTALSGVVDSG